MICEVSVQLESFPTIPNPIIIAKSRMLHKRVKLNVGGIRHEVMWKMLEQVPKSRLGRLGKVMSIKVYSV